MERIQKIQELHKVTEFMLLRGLFAVFLVAVLLNGCATNPAPKIDTESVSLKRAEVEIPESELLDVRIEIFTPGELPESEEQALGLSKEIRMAESHYIPVQLKNEMQQTGHWGAVRVVPKGTTGAEVLVTGKIINSDGEILELEVNAQDAIGNYWLGKRYQGAVDRAMYEKSAEDQTEAFQNVYRRIANDLADYRLQLTPEQVKQIRRVAEMQFAQALAPTALGGYLIQDEKKGLYRIDRLPSEEDTILIQVRRIRERDYLLVDTLDSQYDGLYRDMQVVYRDWRQARITEIEMIREVESKKHKEQAKAVGLILGSIAIAALGGNNNSNYSYNPSVAIAAGSVATIGVQKLFDASEIGKEAEINKAALEELGASFSADVNPIIVELEGETIELTGTAESKYQQWREVLGRLYAIETEAELAPDHLAPSEP